MLDTEETTNHLRRRTANDGGSYVRATVGSVHRICHEPTSRELIWALACNAALDSPHACLRAPGTVFFKMLKNALIDAPPQGNADEMLTEPHFEWEEVVEQLLMKAPMRAFCGMRDEEGTEKAHAGAAATAQWHAELRRHRKKMTITRGAGDGKCHQWDFEIILV